MINVDVTAYQAVGKLFMIVEALFGVSSIWGVDVTELTLRVVDCQADADPSFLKS